MRTSKFYYPIVLLMAVFFINMGCGGDSDDGPGTGGDDDTPTVTITVTTEDFTNTVLAGVENGDDLGTVVGNSPQGAVSFAINSQSPDGAMAINSTSGALRVADATAFVAGNDITAEVAVSRGDVTETANVTIAVADPNNCDPNLDLSAFVGNVILSGVGFPGEESETPLETTQGVGAAADQCNTITITGDVATLDCSIAETITLTFVPVDGTTGNVLTDMGEGRALACDDETTISYNNIVGSYDLSTNTIVITSELILTAGGESSDPSPVQLTIVPGTVEEPDAYVIPESTTECAGAVDVSYWVGNIQSIEDGFEPYEIVGSLGEEDCTLVLTGDTIGFGCPEISIVLHFIPDAEGSQTGTVTVDEQNYTCDEQDVVNSVRMTGTYDLSTNSLSLDYEYLEDGELDYDASIIITKE